MSVAAYARNRWETLVSSTAIHGVKEVNLAPNCSLKMLWLLLLFSFSGLMSYQIYQLTAHFLQEPVIIVIKSMSDTVASDNQISPKYEYTKYTKYKLPLTLLLIPTMDLFNASPDANRALKESPFDRHGQFYIRSLVDADFQVPHGYNGTRGRRQFDKYLADNPHLTWHDVVSPFVTNVSYWLGNEDNIFRIVDRTISAYMTYHFISPDFGKAEMNEADQTKDILLDGYIDFNPNVMNKSTSDHGRTPIFCLTSYGLATDMVRLERGISYKISFDITGHRKSSLRRRPCAVNQVQYQTYDYEACDHQCRFDSKHKWTPQTCYRHTDDWGFYKTFAIARPCSHGVHYEGDDGMTNVESETYVHTPSPDDFEKVERAYNDCLRERCARACQQMSAKFSVKTSDFHERLKNRSLIWMTWPGPAAVPVYVEMLQYTWDGYVGQLGGLMGLWMGASMVSALEAFYICCCCCVRVRENDKSFSTMRRLTVKKLHKKELPCVENGTKAGESDKGDARLLNNDSVPRQIVILL